MKRLLHVSWISQEISMSTDRKDLDVNDVKVEVLRKAIKNLHIGVYPPDGHVRLAAPLRLSDEAIRLAVIARLGWIRRQQEAFAGQERQSKREMVTGESHYFAGRRYRLNVVEQTGRNGLYLRNASILELVVPRGANREVRERILERWYRQQLRQHVMPLLEKWQPVIGVTVKEVFIKRMKTLWGSCNSEAGRLWLNLELMKKPPMCLEYILVHEMTHLLERRHNRRFHELIDSFLPNWQLLRKELNRTPLSHANWQY